MQTDRAQEETTFTDMRRVEPEVVERDPIAHHHVNRRDVEAIEDQILRLAFQKAMKTIKTRTLVIVFMCGMVAGFVGLGVILAVLVSKVGGA